VTVHVELTGFSWRPAGRRAWAVRGIDLRIARGERVLLAGPSGAGKSTLLAAIAGLLPEDSGEQARTVTVAGMPARAARAGTGMLFQDPQTQLVMARAGDDVAFGLENRAVPPGEIWPRVDAALAEVGFPYGRERATGALSGGEQQRLALAGTVALRPSLVVLDEPTANLDPAGAELVRAALARVLGRRDVTLILVEHRVAEALPLVDRVVVLGPDGRLAADGTPDAVFGGRAGPLAELGVWVPGHAVTPRRAAGPPGEPLLTADRVGLTHRGADRPALAPTSVEVRAGEALAVLGPNGSGKTTLALLLGGLLAPTTGTVRMPGAPPAAREPAGAGPPHRWPAAELARRIGSVFQNPEHQFLTARVDDELALGPRRAGRPAAEIKSLVDELLQRLRLDRLAAANPYTLSGGEQRRLSVATALACAPRVLILDEPTFGQDRRTWTELVELLADLRDAGHAVVTVTHDPDVVTALADRALDLGPTPVRAPA
jgi:energy-coupling factor transport system ATP-binding protein